MPLLQYESRLPPDGCPGAAAFRHPPSMDANYELFNTRCVKCHSLERIYVAVTTEIAPISGQPFNKKAVLKYSNKMLRKADYGMNKKEVAQVVVLLNYFIAAGNNSH